MNEMQKRLVHSAHTQPQQKRSKRQVCLDARTAEQSPEMEWVTMEDPRARAVISEIPYCVSGQPLPLGIIGGLPKTVAGVWSLWEIRLLAEGFSRKRFFPVFATDDGRTFVPTAKRIWALLLTENVQLKGIVSLATSTRLFETPLQVAKHYGERIFSDLLGEHRTWLAGERERARYAFDARQKAIGRVGLPAVRQHRRKRLDAEFQARTEDLNRAEASVPDLNAVMLIRIDDSYGSAKSQQVVCVA